MNRTVIIAMALILSSHAFAGVTLTSTSTTDSEGRRSEKSTVTTRIEGDNARMEWTEGNNPAGQPGGYIVTRDGGKTLYLVNPEEKTYMLWDVEKMMQMVGGMMQGMQAFMSMKMKEYKVEKVLDEAGPDLLGYPTRHYKFITRYTMETSTLGMKQTSSGTREEELWTTEKLDAAQLNAFRKLQIKTTGMQELDKIIEAEKARTVRGYPLKMVSVTKAADGRSPDTVTTMEVSRIVEESIAESVFTIPESYTLQKMEMPDAAEADPGDEAGAQPPPQGLPVKIPFMKKLPFGK